MLLVHPHYLWLLVLAPLLAFAGYRTSAPGGRRWLVALLRAAAVAALVLALARPVLRWRDDRATTVCVLDLSPSQSDTDVAARLEEARSRYAGDGQFKVVAFSSRAELVEDERELREASHRSALRERLARPLWPDDPAAGGSALADALRLAGACVPHDAAGQVVLVSDGVTTRGDASAEAYRLARRGVAVVVPSATDPATSSALVVRSAHVPAVARIGQTVVADVTIETTAAGPATLVVTSSGRPIATAGTSLQQGLNVIRTQLPLHAGGLVLLEFAVRRESASRPDEAAAPTLLAAVEVAEPLRVVVVVDREDDPAPAALASLLGESSRIVTLDARALDDPQTARGSDVLVVADVPAERLSGAAQRNLRQAVSEGAGLLFTGASRAFGPGGWGDTSLSQMLPVRMPQQLDNQDPSATLVFIVDTSGSMTGPRISLAKEVVRLALRRLQPHDKAGIVEFYGNKRWAAPIQPASNALELNRALNRLDAGGGTVILPAIEEAAYALRNVNTRTRHVLILTDGGVESGPFEQVARKMTEDGITISTVLCGPGQHSSFLANLAQWGRGRFYSAPDRFSLPEIIVRQPQTAVPPPIVQTPTALQLGNDPLTRTLSANAATLPPVRGYVRTSPKPTADVLLKTAGGDAILARWRFGSGWVAALPTQLGSQATQQLGTNPEFASLLASLFRSIAKDRDGQQLRIEPLVRAAGLELDVTLATTDRRLASRAIEIEMVGPDGSTVRRVRVEPAAAGRWNVLLEGMASGAYRVRASAADDTSVADGSAAVVIPAPREHAALSADAPQLAAIAGFADLARRRAAEIGGSGSRFLEVWKPLAFLSLLSLLAHVAARRWPGRWKPGGATAEPLSAPRDVQTTRSARGAGTLAALALGLACATPVASPLHAQTQPASRESVRDHLENALAREGDVSGVLAQIQTALQESPDSADLLDETAHASVEHGSLTEASAALRRLAELRPDDADVARRLAIVEELRGDDAAAEQALRRALALVRTPEQTRALSLRLAVLLFDAGRSDDAVTLLRDAVKTDPTGATAMRAGVIAGLYARYDDAAGFLHLAKAAPRTPATAEAVAGGPVHADPADDLVIRQQVLAELFEGSAHLRSNRAAEAAESFEAAMRLATLPRDRRFATERLIAAARAAGSLSELATAWLNDPALPAERLLPLAAVLRELGRVDDLLKLWRAEPATPAHRDALRSSRLVNEVFGAVSSGGRVADAEGICRQMLETNPNSEQWLGALLRLLIDQGKVSDADRLLRDRIDAAANATRLLRLADMARSVGREEIALEAADRLSALGGEQARQHQVDALLLQAQIFARRGQRDECRALLGQAAEVAEGNGPLTATVVDALEQNGARAAAIDLLRTLTSASSQPGDGPSDDRAGEDVLRRLAWLLEQENRLPEAQAIWARLFERAAEPSRRTAAKQRLLDLASKTGTIADLAADLEDRLAGGRAGATELMLLLDIYVGARDVTSAAEILHTFRSLAGTESEMLRQLANLYLKCNQFGQADKVLRRLVETDPDRAIDTLQEVAVIALERNRPADAQAALAEIARRTGETPAAAELRAGILAHLKQPAEAAREYRKAIGGNPDQVEDWLLWANAMSESRQKDRAIARLQFLVEQTGVDHAALGVRGAADGGTNGGPSGAANGKADDLFTVAVDGLLNLDAPRSALRAARRQVILHASASPRQLIFFQLAVDLCDSLADPAMAARALESALPAGGEQRSEQLRELLALARIAGETDRAVEYGRTLIALGDQFPPQVFLELGQILLSADRLPEADRAFARAIELSDDDEVARQVARQYELSGHPREALRLLQPLIARQPYDVGIRARLAGLYHQLDEIPPAFGHYLRALELVLRRDATDASDVRTRGRGGARVSFALAYSPGRTVTEADQLLEPLLTGALETARTPETQAKLVGALWSLADERLASARAAGESQPPGPLLQIMSALRRVSFALGRPAAADEFDRQVLSVWPNHGAIHAAMVQARVDWGLLDRAAVLAKQREREIPLRLQVQELMLHANAATTTPVVAQNTPASSPTTTGPSGTHQGDDPELTARLAVAALPQLIARGRMEQAREMLRAVPVRVSGSDQDVSSMLAAAAALDDTASADAWAVAWFDAAERTLPAQPSGARAGSGAPLVIGRVATPARVGSITACVTASWPAVSEAGRAELTRRLVTAALRSNEREAAELSRLALRLANATGSRPVEWQALLNQAAAGPMTGAALAELLSIAAPPDRPALVRRVAASTAGRQRRSVILDCVGRLEIALDDATRAALVEAATDEAPATQPGSRPAADDRAAALARVAGNTVARWYTNSRQPQLVDALATALADRPPTETAERVALAAALRAVGKPDQADRLALEVVESLLATPPAGDTRLAGIRRSSEGLAIDGALRVLSPQARRRLAESVRPPATGPSDPAALRLASWQALGAYQVLKAEGRNEQAISVLREAFLRQPQDPQIGATLARELETCGRSAELLELFEPHLTDATVIGYAQRATLQRASGALHRADLVVRLQNMDERSRSPQAVKSVRPTDAPRDILLAMRWATLVNRWERSQPAISLFGAAGATAPAGTLGSGLRDIIAAGGRTVTPSIADLRVQRGAAFREVVDQPWALDELSAALRGADGDANEYTIIAESLVRAADTPAEREALTRRLEARRAAGAMTLADRLVLLELARDPSVTLPPALAAELELATVYDPSSRTFAVVADVLSARGSPAAASYRGWVEHSRSFERDERSRSAPTATIGALPEARGTQVRLQRLIDRGEFERAEEELNRLRAIGVVSLNVPREMATVGLAQPPSVLWLRARLAAERGDAGEFGKRLGEAIDAHMWDEQAAASWQAPRLMLDLTPALPGPTLSQEQSAAMAGAALAALRDASARYPGETDLARDLCLLGYWSLQRGLTSHARQALDLAVALADQQGLGEQHLWAADLATELSQPEMELQIHRRLLEARRLPSDRMAPVLQRLADSGQRDAAVQLARDAAGYCREPRLTDWLQSVQ